MAMHNRPSSRASSIVRMKAPLPTLMSSATAEVPLATFLAIMLAAMRPRSSTVAVTSRNA